jgi:hypothetical protein
MDNVQEHNKLSSQTFKPYWNARQVYLCIKVGHCKRAYDEKCSDSVNCRLVSVSHCDDTSVSSPLPCVISLSLSLWSKKWKLIFLSKWLIAEVAELYYFQGPADTVYVVQSVSTCPPTLVKWGEILQNGRIIPLNKCKR